MVLGYLDIFGNMIYQGGCGHCVHCISFIGNAGKKRCSVPTYLLLVYQRLLSSAWISLYHTIGKMVGIHTV